jgi:hypothetical protein
MTGARTPFCFLTGLLNTMAIDWTGQGPTYRLWRIGTSRQLHQHGIGQIIGFLIMLSLIVAATVLCIMGHDIFGLVAAFLLLTCTFCANLIAARLP